MDMNTPKRVKTFSSYINSPPSVDNGQQNWSFQSPTPTNIYESPVSENHKRGRPRSEALTNLMIEGTSSPSGIKCKVCFRVFPREKSLAAHTRTHTGNNISLLAYFIIIELSNYKNILFCKHSNFCVRPLIHTKKFLIFWHLNFKSLAI
jgi:hypothetical protein